MRLPRVRPVWLRPRLSKQPPKAAPSGASPVSGDGRADAGEVVWAWVPYEEDASRGKDRPVLVIAVEQTTLVCLPMTSKDHDRDEEQEAGAGRFWMDIGSGAWDSRGRPSEVRLDRILRLEATAVRREGAVLADEIFQQVLAAVRS